jgi:formylglycine-generating enzyme required for sulfatase activity
MRHARIWPWGDNFDKAKANINEGHARGATPVGSYSAKGGDSSYGYADMTGNVWELLCLIFLLDLRTLRRGRVLKEV